MEIVRLIEAVKDGRRDVFTEMTALEGRAGAISSLSEIIGKRAYFTIDEDGRIERKNMNYALPLAAFTTDEGSLGEQLFELAEPIERVRHKKIERLSKESLEKLNKNFFKILANNNVDFARRYSKELYMRNKEEFFKKLFHYTLIEGVNSQKTLMALALKRLLWDRYDDNIMNAGITYISSVRGDFGVYEDTVSAGGSKSIKDELLAKMPEVKSSRSREGLKLLAYLKVLGEYSYGNEDVFIKMAERALADRKEGTQLNSYEEEILKGL